MLKTTGQRFRTVRALDMSAIPSADASAFAQPIIKTVDASGNVLIKRDIAPIYPNARSQLSIVSTEFVGVTRGELAAVIANIGALPSDSVLARAWLLLTGAPRVPISEIRLTPLASQTNPISSDDDVVINAKPSAAQAAAGRILPQYARASFLLPDSLVRGQNPGSRILVTAVSVDGRSLTDSVVFSIPTYFGAYSSQTTAPFDINVPSGRFAASISPGAFNGETLVTVQQLTSPVKSGQPDIDPPGAKAGRPSDACQVLWLAPDALPRPNSVALTLKIDGTDTSISDALASNVLRVGFWNENQKQWELIDSQNHIWAPDSSFVRVPVDRAGLYGFVVVDDVTPPSIEVSTRGQQFGEGAYISPFTKFVAMVEDRNGISTAKGSFRVWIDEILLPDSLISVPTDVPSITALPVSISPPTLAPREAPYRLRIAARDAVGNIGEYTATFRISGQATLDFYGNFPNPFGVTGTVFAFSFTQQISEVTFRIYDLAGRQVLRFNNYDLSALHPDDPPGIHQSASPYKLPDRNGIPLVAPSYHELVWSGRDAYGDELANGVYFGVITVRDEAGNEVAKRTFTMVKAE
jgi:hypothetical protein